MAKNTGTDAYRKYIENLEAHSKPKPFTVEERKAIAERVRDYDTERKDAEQYVLEQRVEDEDADREAMAAERHRSYLPLVEAGLMSVYEAVREVGANRSANGRGQER